MNALEDLLGDDLSWVTSEALCGQVDPDIFFPEMGGKSRAATRVCRDGPLINPCAKYALTHAVRGVWGGISEKQRRDLGAPTWISSKDIA